MHLHNSIPLSSAVLPAGHLKQSDTKIEPVTFAYLPLKYVHMYIKRTTLRIKLMNSLKFEQWFQGHYLPIGHFVHDSIDVP